MTTRDTPKPSPLPPRPRSRHDFRIAIVCALTREAETVELILDKDWSKESPNYGKAPRDHNTYTTGVIAGHNIVLVYMSGMGSNKAAAAANQLQMSFTGIELIFLVGICGAVRVHPVTGEEIVLGDCIISRAVIQYDLGRLGPGDFERKTDLDGL